ncbi:PREDICTED: MATH domain and coiled-coil domain-containing protein At2g42475-like [Camelina sativa]|uniref:MATH domain and coiled-coil domain-containing protein At2g42475-like n=1 Tax=Camelina sativa TaxID=90675 RepID=A0ABM1RLA6_CAMSA|nr:PREDICTED: MATH domain and coiled-coil domain-containing protein At2g42475-like [Camelina sativa]
MGFTFEIDNFSEKKDVISSPIFISGGCDWFVRVHPKRYLNKDHVSVYLHVANPESLQPGWKRRAKHSFIMLNQSGEELKRTSEACDLFCNEVPAWGYPKVLPVSKLKEEEFLENDKLIIKVELQVVEVVHKGNASGTEMLDINEKADADGSHVQQVEERVKNPELMELKFKLDYLQTKLEEVSLERRKAEDADRSRVQQLEERVKNFELMGIDSKLDCLKSNLQELSSERKESYYANKSRVIQTEERVKNLELMELDDLKSKLDELSLERKKSDDANESVVTQLDERIKNLELMGLNYKVDLKSKLDHVYLARKKSDDAYRSRVQQLEECFKNLELMVLDLKSELDKEKAKFCDDDFLLVNEFA